MSPVEIFGIPCSRANRSAWVPLPAPGGPITTTLRATSAAPSTDSGLFHEAIVVPHDQLRLHLVHRVHGDAHDDQERRAPEEERHAQALREPLRQVGIEL